MTPTDSHLKIIKNLTRKYLDDSRSPLEAFDRAKRDLRSAIDIDWRQVRFHQVTFEVTRVQEPPKKSESWANATVFMLADQMGGESHHGHA